MFPPHTDLADSRQESARDRWVQQQMEDAMRYLPTDLEVLPSPLLLEQMEDAMRYLPTNLEVLPSPLLLEQMEPKPSAQSTFLWFDCRGGGFPASRREGCGK
ncbi:hypothetical protein CRENBAI_021317 [Crenichthys baileyi]|uniref:Uncharacterized protein n=1 Tax=Crenichthys baileyi TaxID=28760 RepID=A0AAV9R353_9TELE